MRFLGAKVVLTPAHRKGTGMLGKAIELAKAHGWFLCRQFENEANAEIHSRTTAREILADFEGDRLDYWVTGAGTGGTLKGVARVLREARPDTKVILCETENSPMLGSGIRQPRQADGSLTSHPLFRPHLVQGWTPDFIPKLTEDALDAKLVDKVVPIDSGEAMRLSRELAQKEGIFTGISGGATLAGALAICATAPEGSTVLCMLPDTGERYLSTPLFEGISADMTEEEIAISQSTPDCQFGTAAAPAATTDALTDEGRALVAAALSDRANPVVMFAFEWCEFCWSVRKLFKQCGIAYRSIDIDSVEMQKDDRGGKIRAAVGERAGTPTIPQVFIGGTLIGGATETFDAFKDGRLKRLLEENGVAFDARVELDPYTLLPGWLQKRDSGGGAVCGIPKR